MSVHRRYSTLLGVAMIVCGGVQSEIGVYQQFLTPAWQGVLTSAVGITMLVLQYLEKQGRSKRSNDDKDEP